ncbi:hypothetical protein J4H86_09165 [Spiractinospora alimapuensis]|uniref:hypothetical protein n=1 Tax=Spiractinospora alimapuensis TaxID=2820884 RepID=UPI001F3A9813|nr:hypothetical protein [Spiractinospora alimapuensis]QVQ53859.1 hypothetical protein J4H86_09165 [Spiractinospora alimapuensis]
MPELSPRANVVTGLHERLSEMTTDIYREQLEPGAGTISARESVAAEGVSRSSTAEVTGIHAITDGQIMILVQGESGESGGENDGEEEEHEFIATVVPHQSGRVGDPFTRTVPRRGRWRPPGPVS